MNNKQIGGIIIDAGHGGIDSGAVGNNLLEKDLTLKVSQYMQKRFQELGIPSKMTREGDEYLPKNERVKKGGHYVEVLTGYEFYSEMIVRFVFDSEKSS